MSDFRQHDRRKRVRKHLKGTFATIYYRTKGSLEAELDKYFRKMLTTKPL